MARVRYILFFIWQGLKDTDNEMKSIRAEQNLCRSNLGIFHQNLFLEKKIKIVAKNDEKC